MNLYKNLLMKKYLYIVYLLAFMLLTPTRTMAVGFIPTDAGLAVNFQPGDQFLLSVVIDGQEYFVCDYPTRSPQPGDKFNYPAGNYLKLLPQAAGAMKPSDASVWTIDTALTRGKNNMYALGGISYTMWSSGGYTLQTRELNGNNSAFKFLGILNNDETNSYLCDVVFVVPTVRATTNMDPNGTLEASHEAEGRHRGAGTSISPSWAFDGKMGVGFAGMIYREVYWFDIPRANDPNTYTNASLVTFNTTSSQKSWSDGQIKCDPGRAAYAFADNKHKPTQRTLFRLYVLGDEKPFTSCSSYFFGWDTQDYLRYRDDNNGTKFTTWRKIYTLDHYECMELVKEGEPYYQTKGMKIPPYDSTYFYVGYNDAYHSAKEMGSGDPKSCSAFKPINTLRIRQLKDAPTPFVPSKNAYGYMAIDTTLSEDNLGVAFEPAGYFFQTNSGVNVPLRQLDDSTWMSDEMWYIAGEYMLLEGRVVLYTGPEFSAKDPGAEIVGWTDWVKAPEIPVAGSPDPDVTAEGKYGWPRIHTNRAAKNGGIEFVEANKDTLIQYHNNGHFGAVIPDQYPEKGSSILTIQDARLLGDYEFAGWANTPNGSVIIFPQDSTSKSPRVGQEINLKSLPAGLVYTHGPSGDTLHLYAKAAYKGSINVAISFLKEDGKRYFLTHPGGAPRQARARHYDDWTNVRQGIGDANNTDPNYLTSYKIIGKEGVCAECDPGEYVLDPKYETQKGAIDSLVFYGDFQPDGDEYLGLYYIQGFDYVIANNTWAGLFRSKEGWPTPANPCVENTHLSSTHYLERDGSDVIQRYERTEVEKNPGSASLPPNIEYKPSIDRFDGATGEGTEFMISGVGVVDAHYVILPDTTDATTPWLNEITFDYHTESSMQQVWSKLIGKQLLAQMKVGNDTIYFHPNPDKTFNTASELRLSNDYRMTHDFTYIYDKRAAVAGRIAVGDSVRMEETENAFCCNIHSGNTSPIGPETDIVDTLRVWLKPASTSKIKAYYGRWKKSGLTDGLTVKSDGSRYRDILVKTKTYHYGPEQTNVVLKPELDLYNFGALKNLSQTLTFNVIEERYRWLLDAAGNEIRKEVLSQDTIKNVLDLSRATCTLKSDTVFTIGTQTTTGITLTTQADNATGDNHDTLTVTTSVTISDVVHNLTVKVPLIQTDLTGDELIWSVKYNNKYYFITIESGALRFRPFDLNGSRWQRNSQELKLGSYNANNTDHQYMTPWKFRYDGSNVDQLVMKTEYGVDKYFNIAEGTPGVSASDSALLTYEYVHVYTNDNANVEEQVKLKYGPDQWLKVTGSTPSMTLTSTESEATVFSWGYLSQEYQLLNNGTYPSVDSLLFGYNNGDGKVVQTPYKAYREYSMLVNNTLTYLCRENETNYGNLSNAEKDWKTTLSTELVEDARTFDADASSGFTRSTTNFATTVTPESATSPKNVTIGGKYVNIVDTLKVTLSSDRTDYRFKDWKNVSSLEDAALKIPLVRKTYHTAPYDSVICAVENDEYNYAFPSTLPSGVGTLTKDSCHKFVLNTNYYKGTRTLDVDDIEVAYVADEVENLTGSMALNNHMLAEIRLVDEYGKKPDWCVLQSLGANDITIKCTKNGTRSPRYAYMYFAFIVTDGESNVHYVNYRLTVSQASLFQYANNQTLSHSRGITGDEKVDGMQQVHENKRILYYYNPAPYEEADQEVELPVRERDFYGWWRWYREGKDERDFDCSDMDVLDSLWITPPRNVGKYNYPFRIIGDSVKVANPEHDSDPSKPDSIKQLVTMGRYTVFHYPAQVYTKNDPPAKSPSVMAPQEKKTLTYAVDLSNYLDNLPLSMVDINQVDTAVLDTMHEIIEPTLSLREIFELHPWTEMADTLDNYKTLIPGDDKYPNDKYMEDHIVMAPTGNRLLLKTEQRYRYDNLSKTGHSESLLGYYMHDDNWTSMSPVPDANGVSRQDTMIWCGGWDADCEWYTYNPGTQKYTPCTHTVTESDDFLSVPAKGSTTGGAADTVYYCLRALSKKTETDISGNDSTVDGDFWFNICRYKIIYHEPNRYGPLKEVSQGGVTKAIITNNEIEEDYEVLERLNFDYYQPGADYHVYPRPLPWADASYGYSYPVGPEIPDNRYHNNFAPNFPGPGEYGIINRIPYSNYWHKMEQHGGAENGYMIYCDGMSSSGQVAALSLSTHLCEGQKMYFSGYVGNPSNQKDKANPNFTFAVQGWDAKGKKWVDITSYMTGDIKPSQQWYQIFFPIEHEKAFDDFRVRIYNMASSWDGNDFIIDDMCVFATKPPLIAYQANTKCVEANENDSIIHVVLRVDYQGFTDKSYNDENVAYTVEQVTKGSTDTCFVPMLDGYLAEQTKEGAKDGEGHKIAPDTIYGEIYMPAYDYFPMDEDSIFPNLNDLAESFQKSYDDWTEWKKTHTPGESGEPVLFREGYIFENLDGVSRPVKYVVHNAKMTADKKYTVRLSLGFEGLMSSQCAMTSDLSVTNRMMLMLNGNEQEEKEVDGVCANTTYEVSLRVRGTLIKDSVAPMPLTGSCSCDWLIYGDTVSATSLARYGYYYTDIEKVVRYILRNEDPTNTNLTARNLGEVNRNVMKRMQTTEIISFTTPGHTDDHPYDILVDLINKGFLSIYESDIYVSVTRGDSVQYVVFPIPGTGTDDLQNNDMDVCPVPIVIKLKPRMTDMGAPLIIGGLHRDSTQANIPITVVADAENANKELALPVDSIRTMIGIHSVTLLTTDDPNYREGVHRLALTSNKVWPRDISGYYAKGDTIFFTPASNNNYMMRSGYNYTFNIEMVTATDNPTDEDGCPIGDVPFTVSVVPDVLRWAPSDKSNNNWNDPMNWIGVTADNVILHENARFAPLASTDIIIPEMPDSLPYPNLPNLSTYEWKDSVQAVGFVYNICDDIRFLPGAAIGQQQNLTSDVVVVDMTMPYNKWALRATPITGMLSGDLFMAEADLSGETKMWSVGTFDASGRNYKTGNATYWLSLYDKTIIQKGNGDQVSDSTREAEAAWSRLANGMTEYLAPTEGWAVYARTKSGKDADVRLPKNDDVYYYFYASGDPSEISETNLRTKRDTYAGGSGKAGKLAFQPTAGAQSVTLTNVVASNRFVFGNPTMGYIDIWGFVADNGLEEEIDYINESGIWQNGVTKASAEFTTDTISNLQRYLPPMHAMIIKVSPAATTKTIKLNTNRIVTHPNQVVPVAAPSRRSAVTGNPSPVTLQKGIMTVTAVNPFDAICRSRLLLGQGYHDAVLSGEDAMLMTVNINNFSSTTPSTPFTIYAVNDGNGLSIDLRDSIVNVPISFSMTEKFINDFDPVTYLWFTGVNAIDGPLALYDALMDTERPIVDGICLAIETPEVNHQRRYYIRRRGFTTQDSGGDTPTGIGSIEAQDEQAVKIMYHGNVYILRGGHVYTVFGQKVR